MKFPLLFLGWLMLTSAAVAADSGRRAITHEDLWLLKRVGEPVASPDGRWAAFSVTHPAYDPKEQSQDVWLVATDGASAPRQITQTKAGESGLSWNPDGNRLAFSAKREGDEVAQIYVLDLAQGGEAQRVTNLSTGARSPEWSPDGATLLFVSDVYPGAGDDEANKKAAKVVKERKYHARVYEGFPIRNWDHWRDERIPHLFVQEAKSGAPARDLLAGTRLASMPGFSGVLGNSGQALPATWAPDDRSIVFTATTVRHQTAYAEVPLQLFEVPAAGGEPRRLTNDPHSYGKVEFTSDGKTLVVGCEPGGDGRTYHHDRIVAFPWPFDAAGRRVLTANLDLPARRFALSEDGATVYFLADDGVRTILCSVPMAGGEIRRHAGPETGCLGGLSSGGKVLVATHESATQPPEVVVMEASGHRVLTHFNDETIARLDLPRPERFGFTSAQGRPIDNLLVRPAGFDSARKYPLLVVMHGGPAPQFKDQWVLRWNYHLLAAPGYVVLLTNYSGSSGYTEAFGQAIQQDPLKGPADEINQGADEASRRFAFIEAQRQAAAGASYGGHLANWMQATTTRYKCLISHAGLVNLDTQWSTSDSIYHRELNNGGPIWEQGPIWREQNPARLVPNHFRRTGWVTPMLVTVGRNDFRVPENNSLENWTYLQRLQIPSKLIVFPDENHWILKGENSRFWYSEVHAWLARWLK